MGSPSVYHIPPEYAFLDSLARGLSNRFGTDPLALARVTILLPNRRSARALEEAFINISGATTTILPSIQAIGDIDEDELHVSSTESFAVPTAIPRLERRMLLSRLIREMEVYKKNKKMISEQQALMLAQDLGGFLDDVQRGQLSFDALKDLVPSDLAEHWQDTIDFLGVLSERWPEVLKENNYIDNWERKNILLSKQSEAWKKQPPEYPVIAAGSTGSLPAAAELLKTIAHMPNGFVVLQGIDQALDEDAWNTLEEDHPQFALKKLLKYIGADRVKIEPWEENKIAGNVRSDFLREVMRPAATIHAWQNMKAMPLDEHISVVETETEEEEAQVIALKLRQVMDAPGKNACLITHDRSQARRVSSLLKYWDIAVDDSAGKPLAYTAPMTFIRAIGEMVASRFAPVKVLAALKHPLAAGGAEVGDFRAKVRALEMAVLRGVRVEGGMAAMEALLTKEKHADLTLWVHNINSVCTPLTTLLTEYEAPLNTVLETHLALAETLAASGDVAGHDRLWAGDEGEAAFTFLKELLHASRLMPKISTHNYTEVLDEILRGHVYRPRYNRHTRISILNPTEARLLSADVMVMGALNQSSAQDSVGWMSRPMAEKFGLEGAEQVGGLAAHDFVNACHADEVLITRAKKSGGVPTMPSVWLIRMDVVARKMGIDEALFAGEEWIHAARQVFTPEGTARTAIEPPAPKPPASARPEIMYATHVETLMQDPYVFYAQHILKLRELDPIDQEPDNADFGSLIHDALDVFNNNWRNAPPKDEAAAHALFLSSGEEAFKPYRLRPAIYKVWWPRYRKIAEWFVPMEWQLRLPKPEVYSEITGEMAVKSPAGKVVSIRAKADRIEKDRQGHARIIDYKTGTMPTAPVALSGFFPQLTLEGLIAVQNGFKTAGNINAISSLNYIKVSASSDPGKHVKVPFDAESVLEGLQKLLAAYYDREHPYYAAPYGEKFSKSSRLKHLSRSDEWSGE